MNGQSTIALCKHGFCFEMNEKKNQEYKITNKFFFFFFQRIIKNFQLYESLILETSKRTHCVLFVKESVQIVINFVMVELNQELLDE